LKKTIKNIWQVLDKKERLKFILLSALDILISFADILSLAILIWIIQFYLNPSAGNTSILPHWLTNRQSSILIGFYLVFFTIKNIAGLLATSAQNRFISEVAIRVSRKNLLKFQQINYEDFVTNDSSGYIRNIALQPFEFCQQILSGARQIITQAFLISFAAVAIILFNVKLFLTLFVILLPPIIIAFYIIRKELSGIKKKIHISNQLSFQYLMDALKGWVEANIYNRNHFFLDRFLNHRREFSQNLFRSISLQNMPGRLMEIFAILGLFILVSISIQSGTTEGYTLINFGAFVAAAYKIIPGVVKIISASSQIKAYDTLLPELNTKEDRKDPEFNFKNREINQLEYRNIVFSYGAVPLIKNISCAIGKGDFVGISGISGKGKTTFLNITLGFLKPQNGEILFNGEEICNGTTKQFWPHIAYVKQQTFLIHDTISRNITLEETVSDKQKLEWALQVAGVETIIKYDTKGGDKIITENGKNISGGQQQRIAIARALYQKDTDLYLLDEPFNELDEVSTITFLKLFKELAGKGKIIVLITHDQNSLAYCNKIISLDDSR